MLRLLKELGVVLQAHISSDAARAALTNTPKPGPKTAPSRGVSYWPSTTSPFKTCCSAWHSPATPGGRAAPVPQRPPFSALTIGGSVATILIKAITSAAPALRRAW